MKVGEIGFVIKKSDGSYVGRKTRSHPERPFRTWGEANEASGGTPYSDEITMVQLVPVDTTLRIDTALRTVASTPASTPAETSVEYTVVLKSCGPNKISVIKVVREVTRSDIKAAKDLVDRAPEVVKTNVFATEAGEIARKLRDAGAEVEFKITGDR